MRRGRVRRRGAVGRRPGAGAGARAAVAGQGREEGVLTQAFVLQLQLEVLADLLREPLVLLLQGLLQLSLELQQEVATGCSQSRTARSVQTRFLQTKQVEVSAPGSLLVPGFLEHSSTLTPLASCRFSSYRLFLTSPLLLLHQAASKA